MSDKISVELEIINERGLHARAAAAFVKAVDGLDAEIEVERLGQTVGGNSIMGLMMLAAARATTSKVTASGKDAQKAVDALTALVNNRFGEAK